MQVIAARYCNSNCTVTAPSSLCIAAAASFHCFFPILLLLLLLLLSNSNCFYFSNDLLGTAVQTLLLIAELDDKRSYNAEEATVIANPRIFHREVFMYEMYA